MKVWLLLYFWEENFNLPTLFVQNWNQKFLSKNIILPRIPGFSDSAIDRMEEKEKSFLLPCLFIFWSVDCITITSRRRGEQNRILKVNKNYTWIRFFTKFTVGLLLFRILRRFSSLFKVLPICPLSLLRILSPIFDPDSALSRTAKHTSRHRSLGFC